jgi:DNA modification methylase
MSTTVLRGNALSLPLADQTVDLIVTSPPYFGLRSYTDAGEHYAGQIGDELTPSEFVDNLIAATQEMVRVLKPSGSVFVNLGDKYSGAQSQNFGGVGRAGKSPNKSLMGIPWRYAIRCIDDLGLILRAEMIWAKPNGLPESVTDRVRRSHEQWFHFTVQPTYYSAVDEIREAHERPRNTHIGPRSARGEVDGNAQHSRAGNNPLGKLPSSVWTIATEPLIVPDHLGVDHPGPLV